MKLLAIDTATEACSAALWIDGEVRLRVQMETRRQSELILAMVDGLLAEAGLRPRQLDAVAFGRGPGSFTGVRIATGVVQGIAFAADLPVVPVSTLAALAQRAHRERGARRILAAYDARMGEVYWGGYEIHDDGLARPTIPDCVSRPESVPCPDSGEWIGVGSGWAAHGPTLLQAQSGAAVSATDPEMHCSALDIATLGETGLRNGQTVTPEHALPIYLRDQVANKPRSDARP